jgi:hypothetical protein
MSSLDITSFMLTIVACAGIGDAAYVAFCERFGFTAKPEQATGKIPDAACRVCGGWTSFEHANAVTPVEGRTGCTCHRPAVNAVGGES